MDNTLPLLVTLGAIIVIGYSAASWGVAAHYHEDRLRVAFEKNKSRGRHLADSICYGVFWPAQVVKYLIDWAKTLKEPVTEPWDMVALNRETKKREEQWKANPGSNPPPPLPYPRNY